MPRALIFGANGFVGGYLARELGGHGYEVVGSDVADEAEHPDFEGYLAGNLLDADRVSSIVRSIAPDVIVNLAAISSVGQSWKAPALTMQVNVVGTINLLEAARALGESPKILLVGSSEEYAPSDRPLKEDDPLDATNPYGISKVTQERVAEIYGERYGLRIYRTRSFNHTGPGQSTRFVIPSWCKQVAEIEKSGAPGTLSVGNIGIYRDFSDVRDVVRAYRAVLERGRLGEVYNIGSGCAYQLSDIAEMVCGFSGQEIAVRVSANLSRPVDCSYICCNNIMIQEDTGWQPRYKLSETLRLIYEDLLS